MPIVVARVYDSASKGTVDFGSGWRLSAAETIVLEGRRAHLNAENGSVIGFVESNNGIFQLEKHYPSDYSTLVRITPDVFTTSLRTGLTKEFTLINKEFCLTRVIDRTGNELRLLYQNGLLSKIRNATHSIVFSRTKNGRIILARDDQGREVGFKYDKDSRLIEADDRGGNPWKYSYAAEGKLQNATDPLGRLNFAVGFDELGRVHTLLLPSGSIQYRYDTASRSTLVVDRNRK